MTVEDADNNIFELIEIGEMRLLPNEWNIGIHMHNSHRVMKRLDDSTFIIWYTQIQCSPSYQEMLMSIQYPFPLDAIRFIIQSLRSSSSFWTHFCCVIVITFAYLIVQRCIQIITARLLIIVTFTMIPAPGRGQRRRWRVTKAGAGSTAATRRIGGVPLLHIAHPT